jgi:hypothetical protein
MRHARCQTGSPLIPPTSFGSRRFVGRIPSSIVSDALDNIYEISVPAEFRHNPC